MSKLAGFILAVLRLVEMPKTLKKKKKKGTQTKLRGKKYLLEYFYLHFSTINLVKKICMGKDKISININIIIEQINLPTK